MRPLSMDDYTDTEFTGQNKKSLVERLGLIPYGAREDSSLGTKIKAGINKLGALVLQDNDAVMDAFQIAKDIAEEYQFQDKDATEDTIRHILLGGLVESVQGQAFIAGREGDDAESKIDHNNNLYGKALREKYPNRDDFIKKAIDNALLIGQGKEAEEVDGRKGIKSFGNNPVPEMQGPMTPPEQGGTASTPAPAPIPQNMPEPDPMKSTDDYTVTQRKGGIMKAKQGTMPMTQATSAPTGGGPKDAQLQPPARPLGRPKKQPASNDPRDIAIAELENELAEAKAKTPAMPTMAKKGTVKVDKEPKESTGMAVMIGLGAPEIDYSKAEEGNPPPGATKKEVADDQLVLMSEGELVVPANVVRYHGLATYEGMRREALGGLQEMEMDGQISYIDEGKTKKTRQGGIMKAQAGVIPMAQAASSQYTYNSPPLTRGGSPPGFYSDQNTRGGNFQDFLDFYPPVMPVLPNPLPAPGPTPTYNPAYTPTYTQTPYGYSAPKVVAPNIGHYLPEDQRKPWMSPDEPPGGVVPGPGIDPTPITPIIPPPEFPGPIIGGPALPAPPVMSEEAKDYLKEGTGQTELSNLEKALQESEQSREDRNRPDVLQYLDPEQNPGFNFGQFKDDVKTISQFTEKDAKKQLKKIGEDVKTDAAKLFGPPRALGDPTSPTGKYSDMPLANIPSAFYESITNPQKAALRNANYNPSKADIAVALNKPGAKEGTYDVNNLTSAELSAAGYNLENPQTMNLVTGYDSKGQPIVQEFGTYAEIDPITGKKLSELSKFELAEKSRREAASERRSERAAKNAKDLGFTQYGVTKVSPQEADAYGKINTALNDGKFDPNGLMNAEQYTDFKKTGLQMKDFFKLSRAEQSFYAAARTGDTVEPWVIESMKQGTTAAFDAMNSSNDANAIRDDKYEIQADKQYKPADAKEGNEVSPLAYWQSEEGKKKAKELGVEVG